MVYYCLLCKLLTSGLFQFNSLRAQNNPKYSDLILLSTNNRKMAHVLLHDVVRETTEVRSKLKRFKPSLAEKCSRMQTGAVIF